MSYMEFRFEVDMKLSDIAKFAQNDFLCSDWISVDNEVETRWKEANDWIVNNDNNSNSNDSKAVQTFPKGS